MPGMDCGQGVVGNPRYARTQRSMRDHMVLMTAPALAWPALSSVHAPYIHFIYAEIMLACLSVTAPCSALEAVY